jgi:hypothetical protein
MLAKKTITELDHYIGKKIQVIAFGAAYLGILQKVDYDKGFLLISDGKDTVTLDLEHVESYVPVVE